MHIIIIGKNHGNRKKWMKELKPLISDPYGFYTESVPDRSIGGIRIYMHDLHRAGQDAGAWPHDDARFIGTCVRQKTEACDRGYEAIVPALAAIPDGAVVIMDHLGSMDACCPGFQQAVLDVFDRCRVLAAMPDRVPVYLEPVVARDDAQSFYADRDDLQAAKEAMRSADMT